MRTMEKSPNASGMEITKDSIRKEVWDYMEEHNLALFPRPVHGRIPNFKGCDTAAHKLVEMDIVQSASLIKVGPDKPQEGVRRLAMEMHKQVIMPIPRLRSGLFVRLDSNLLPREKLKYAATAKGAKELGTPVGLSAVLPLDILVMGSVAVSPQGYRIGKGEGFADLEYGILKEMGSVDDSVPIITTVHDCQVYDELPEELFKEHDMPVDIIVTPSRIIHTAAKSMSLPRPSGIIWELLTAKQIADMPILRILREKLSAEGNDCALKGAYPRFCVKISGFPSNIRIREIKDILFERGIKPSYVSWKSGSRSAILHYNEQKTGKQLLVNEVLSALKELKIGDCDVTVSLSD